MWGGWGVLGGFWPFFGNLWGGGSQKIGVFMGKNKRFYLILRYFHDLEEKTIDEKHISE